VENIKTEAVDWTLNASANEKAEDIGRLMGGEAIPTIVTAGAGVALKAAGKTAKALDRAIEVIDSKKIDADDILKLDRAEVGPNADALRPGAVLRAKWGRLSAEERRALIQSKVDANAEKWVRGYEANLNQQYPELDAHFVDKHGPNIPLRPNLEQRAIDGTHPTTGQTPGRPRAQTSSQFKDWKTQMEVINEATTREARGLPKYNFFDTQGNPAVIGNNSAGVGRSFTPNKLSPLTPTFNPQLNGWIIRFDSITGAPFTGYPTK